MLELPQKELLRVDEAASYFSVTERTIRLWAEHGHLEAVKIVGSIRITRESALKCRFAHKPSNSLDFDNEIKPKAEQPEPEVAQVQAAEKRRGRPKVTA